MQEYTFLQLLRKSLGYPWTYILLLAISISNCQFHSGSVSVLNRDIKPSSSVVAYDAGELIGMELEGKLEPPKISNISEACKTSYVVTHSDKEIAALDDRTKDKIHKLCYMAYAGKEINNAASIRSRFSLSRLLLSKFLALASAIACVAVSTRQKKWWIAIFGPFIGIALGSLPLLFFSLINSLIK